ncbi:tetratricopeptide repeat protein [Anoxybacillus sp. J5B_2022]|uniref:tetratricopeptide repeat protein n=1 Tax=Anoxybacillus sp. J5B_2022 TaxID=3003246 RepID=UPI0022855182|nr:tetratricopeptide repeat protein [Anoxybacillus sp. J5B_2022]MCZ0754789.1 tetratricopeptide repeat protein [Anoxybacillus sp. J5B_2022]
MKKKNNIVPFPNLRERLLEKGWEALQAKQYKTALHFFSEANELKNDPGVELSIVVCLFELGEWEEAKDRCRRLLEKKKDDMQLLQMYLSILIQLQQYDEMETMIRQAVSNRLLAPATRDHLLQLLQFIEKMRHRSQPAFDDKDIRRLLESKRLDDQLQAIHQLEHEAIAPFLPMIQSYLLKEDNHPMAKTMLLRLLTVQRVNEPMAICKFGQTITVIPAHLDEAAKTEFATSVLKLLDRTLTDDNPSLYEIASHLWYRYVYALYPFSPLPACVERWAAALHISACELQGIEEQNEEIAERYGVTVSEIAPLCKKLYEIEKISFI